jgi:hypothetical protein
MALVGMGGDGTNASPLTPVTHLSAWQFTSLGIVHLPAFQLQGPLPATAPLRQFIPTAEEAPVAGAAGYRAAGDKGAPGGRRGVGAYAAAGPSAAVAPMAHHVAQRNVWLLKMYQRVYLAFASPISCRLELYRFYTDTIILQHIYDLVSPKVSREIALGLC